ncbi:hypothetical protein PSPO01_04669 [Paraphaeosphaeria sporulosa]
MASEPLASSSVNCGTAACVNWTDFAGASRKAGLRALQAPRRAAPLLTLEQDNLFCFLTPPSSDCKSIRARSRHHPERATQAVAV